MMGQLGIPEIVVIGIICFTILVPVALGLLAVAWLIQRKSPQGGALALSADRPLDILKARYARGEISKEQFDAMRRDLE